MPFNTANSVSHTVITASTASADSAVSIKIHPHGDTTLTLTSCSPPTKLLVSSPHLILASPYFRALLTGHFSEATHLRQHGHVDIALPEDDPDAMRAVMNALHGRFWDVPGPRIRLQLLSNIAVVVDKYALEDSVCTMLNTWTTTARVGNPRAHLHDVARWFLCVTWAFNQSDMFRFATREFMLDTGFEVDLEGTCVPLPISQKITTRRRKLLTTLRNLIHPLREIEYADEESICSPFCDAIVRTKLEEALALINRGPTSRVKPRTIRRIIADLYDHRMDAHNVIENSASQLAYLAPPCVVYLEHLDQRVGGEFARVRGLALSRYKGAAAAKRKTDWSGREGALNPRSLWPYGCHNG